MKKETYVTLLMLFFGQAFITFVLYFLCNMIGMFVNYVAGGVVAFSMYAGIWWFIWSVQYSDKGISHFYPKLIATTLPLVLYTAFYIHNHPAPTDKTMIALLPLDIHFDFSTAVTCTVLFPLYSIALQRYFLPRNRSWTRFVSAGSALLCIGTALFASCFHFLPQNW